MSDFETEITEQGEQMLVAGVRPVTVIDRLQTLSAAPLSPKKAQKPLNIGLFDEDSRNQLDFFIHAVNKEGRP